jgi:hypothetical protein
MGVSAYLDRWSGVRMMTSAKEAEVAAQPGIHRRTEQPYVAIKALITMQTLGEVLPGRHSEVPRCLARGRFWRVSCRPVGTRPCGTLGTRTRCSTQPAREPGQDMNERETELACKLAN